MADYLGKIFAAQMTRDFDGPWQRILLDRVPRDTRKKIEKIYSNSIPLNQNNIPRMAIAAKKISLGLEKVLPYVGSENIFEFMKQPSGEQASAWHTYGEHYNKQRKLSQIKDCHYQDCVVHGLNTLLVIQDDNWQPFHEILGREKKSRHLSLAKFVDEFAIVIDIQRGTNPDKYVSDALYAQPVEIFHRKYFPATIVTRSELRVIRS